MSVNGPTGCCVENGLDGDKNRNHETTEEIIAVLQGRGNDSGTGVAAMDMEIFGNMERYSELA